jgi:transposase
MVVEPTRPAHLLPLPVAAFVLTPLAREALLPLRRGTPWRTARWLDRALERLDLRSLAGLYRRRGSAPCSPVLMLKLALFCIADGRPSPSDWAEMANRDAPCRWLVWGLEPSASVCYAFRDRLGVDCLFEFNRQVLALAQSDGLSPANRGALDGTLVEACASRHHLVNAPRLEKGLRLLDEPQPPATPATPAEPAVANAAVAPAEPPAGSETAQPPACQDPAPSEPAAKRQRRPVRPGHTPAGRGRQRQRWQRAEQELQRRQARNQNKRASKRAAPDKLVISPTDPEAAVGRDKRGVFRPLYNAQLVADLDSDLILGYEAFAQPNDNGLLPRMLQQSAPLLGHPLQLVLVDAGYTGGQELALAEQAGVAVLGPCAGQSGVEKRSPQQLPKREFRYDAERDVYVCPEGQTLACVGQSQQKRSSVELVVLKQYRCPPGECQACPRQPECCPNSRQGRSLSRSEHEGAIDRLRERMSQPENKKKYQRRAATVERLFGDGKEQRGLKRISGRGLEKVRIQLALTVLQHNLRVLGRAMEAAQKEKRDPPRERRSA